MNFDWLSPSIEPTMDDFAVDDTFEALWDRTPEPLPLETTDVLLPEPPALVPEVYISPAQRWQAAANCIEANTRLRGCVFAEPVQKRDWTALSRASTAATPVASTMPTLEPTLPLLTLPLTLYFKWFYTGLDHEHHAVEATLLWISDHEAIHQITAYPTFPEHFNGVVFPNLSVSAMHLKPIDQNGYESWFIQDPRTKTYLSMNEARKQFQFTNTLPQKPAVPDKKTFLSKPELLHLPLCCTVPDPRFHKELSVGRAKCPRRQRAAAPPIPLTEAIQQFTLPHMCHLLLVYVSEVLPCLPDHMEVCVDDTYTLLNEAWSETEAVQFGNLPAFWQLGVWFLLHGGTAFRLRRRSVGDWSKYLQARCRPQCTTLALQHWCQDQPTTLTLTFAPFTFTADTFTLRDTHWSLQRILEDVGFARHVHFTSVMRSVVSDCPTVYHSL